MRKLTERVQVIIGEGRLAGGSRRDCDFRWSPAAFGRRRLRLHRLPNCLPGCLYDRLIARTAEERAGLEQGADAARHAEGFRIALAQPRANQIRHFNVSDLVFDLGAAVVGVQVVLEALLLKELKKQITDNIKTLDLATTLLEKNVDLVRAAGTAMLAVSKSNGSLDPEKIAEKIRVGIRKDAAGSLSQTENLRSIIVASLAADS